MGPQSVSLALRLIAEAVDDDEAPSRSAVASEIRDVLSVIEAGDSFESRVALFDTLKKLKRRVFKTKGQKKIQKKIERIKELQKQAKPLFREIKDGINFADVAGEEDWVAILQNATKFMGGGSAGLKDLYEARKGYEVTAALGEMDEFYEDHDDEDAADRKIILKAISKAIDESKDRIKKLQASLEQSESDELSLKEEPEKGKEKGKPAKEEAAPEHEVDLSEIEKPEVPELDVPKKPLKREEKKEKKGEKPPARLKEPPAED